MNNDAHKDNTEKPVQIVNPGPSKELWDEVLVRCGFNPDDISEYNARPDERDKDFWPDPKLQNICCEGVLQFRHANVLSILKLDLHC